MRRGKISESVLKRSVLKKIKTHRDEVVSGAGVGTDCAILSLGEGFQTVLATTPVTAPGAELGIYAVQMALNNVAVSGAEPIGIMLTILLPEETEETQLQELMESAEKACSTCGVQIIGGHTEVTSVVKEPVMTAIGVGRRNAGKADLPGSARPGQDVVVSKWIGLEGTVRLAREHREELCSRYPVRMVEEAVAFDRYLSIIPEAATAMKSGVCGMHDVSRGGIFGALWELAQQAGVGLEIDLKKIPVKQETIEICEFFGLNPYELLSGGSLIMTTDHGEALVAALERENIPAVVVGRTTGGNDRVLYNEDEKRYLDRPQADQIYCVGGRADQKGGYD